MARADKATTQPQEDSTANDETRRQQPGAQGAGMDADAVKPDGNVDEKKLERNQERLGVGEAINRGLGLAALPLVAAVVTMLGFGIALWSLHLDRRSLVAHPCRAEGV